MRKSSFLYTAFGVIVVIGALHFIAEAFYLYWTIWWLDIIVHLLAGFFRRVGDCVVFWTDQHFEISHAYPSGYVDYRNSVGSVRIYIKSYPAHTLLAGYCIRSCR